MKEKLAQIVSDFAEQKSLTLKKENELPEGKEATDKKSPVRLYKLEKNGAEIVSIWLIKKENKESLRVDCYNTDFLHIHLDSLTRRIREKIPKISLQVIDRAAGTYVDIPTV